ncbi:zinc-binding protein A33-like [Protopterus annectens]|uniref:zinc-binding protein A33-like n=1 Tax=Protopterus annectens TaxID=7888 RepID=UPI001CFA954D|nr:zinc-binding protein A33-like [Protopterus annectens]
MACYTETESYMEEMTCAICLQLFESPVMLECGHNFCMSCINMFWDTPVKLSCPECRQQFDDRKFTVNRLLANLVEKVQRQILRENYQSEDTGQEYVSRSTTVAEQQDGLNCSEHGKILELFCEEDIALACVLCVSKHYGHHLVSLSEAMSTYQDRLKTMLTSLESTLNSHNDLKVKQEQKASDIKICSQTLKKHISSEFAKLYQFIQNKEQQLLQQLQKDTAGLLREMDKNVMRITEKSSTILQQTANIHLTLELEDPILFLMEVKNEVERSSELQDKDHVTLVNRELNSSLYKNPELLHNVWKEMESIVNPMIPNQEGVEMTQKCLMASTVRAPSPLMEATVTSLSANKTLRPPVLPKKHLQFPTIPEIKPPLLQTTTIPANAEKTTECSMEASQTAEMERIPPEPNDTVPSRGKVKSLALQYSHININRKPAQAFNKPLDKVNDLEEKERSAAEMAKLKRKYNHGFTLPKMFFCTTFNRMTGELFSPE